MLHLHYAAALWPQNTSSWRSEHPGQSGLVHCLSFGSDLMRWDCETHQNHRSKVKELNIWLWPKQRSVYFHRRTKSFRMPSSLPPRVLVSLAAVSTRPYLFSIMWCKHLAHHALTDSRESTWTNFTLLKLIHSLVSKNFDLWLWNSVNPEQPGAGHVMFTQKWYRLNPSWLILHPGFPHWLSDM